jgi:hypothetical protein
MAVNLWNSNPTSFNPLPNGWINYAEISYSDYTISFRAKSQSNARIGVCDTGREDFSEYIDLSKEFKTYTFSFTSKATQRVYIYETAPFGDVVVEGVTLVETAPVVKRTKSLTLNGVPTFDSGLWTINPLSKVIDAETLQLSSEVSGQTNAVNIDVIPDETYTFSVTSDSDRVTIYHLASANGTELIYNSGKVEMKDHVVTFKAKYDRVVIKLYSLTAGAYIFKQPMLVRGSTKIPYQRTTGKVMVPPYPKKNLLPPFTNGEWSFAGQNLTIVGDYEAENNAPLTNYEGCRYMLTYYNVGQTYTISFDDCSEDTKIWIHYINKGYSVRQDSGSLRGAKSYTFTTPTDLIYDTVRVIFDNATSRNRMWVKNPMMVEGGVPARFEPYEMQVSAKPKRPEKKEAIRAPKKNLFDYKTNSPVIVGSGATLEVNNGSYLFTAEAGAYAFSFKAIPVEKNTNYTYSVKQEIFEGAPLGVRYHFPSDGTYSTITGSERTFNTGNADSVVLMYYAGIPLKEGRVKVRVYDIQLEKGTTKTPHEPYELTNKPARR